MPDEQPPTRWQTFTGWHRTEALWRELYARTVSGLTVALVVYIVGVFGGVFSAQPLRVVFALATVFFLVPAIKVFPQWRAARRELKALPDDDPAREELSKKVDGLRFIWMSSLGAAWLCAIAVWGATPGKPWWVALGGG